MRTIAAIILAMFVFPAHSAWAQPGSVGGRELFRRGQYQAAWAALQPGADRGEPEALFLVLVIRRNGLDGRPAAGDGERAALWSALAARGAVMRRSLNDKALPEAVADVYRAALAQLEYFGPLPPAWPPGPPDAVRADRGRAAEKRLGASVRRFGPAMNFAAFLALEPQNDRPGRAFKYTLSAAEGGDHLAMGNLAWMYREGLGQGKDDLRAAYWARRGCDSVPPAPRNANEVGYVYESGRGVSRDSAEARAWYEKAAARGHPAAAANLQRLKSKNPSVPVLDNRLWF